MLLEIADRVTRTNLSFRVQGQWNAPVATAGPFEVYRRMAAAASVDAKSVEETTSVRSQHSPLAQPGFRVTRIFAADWTWTLVER